MSAPWHRAALLLFAGVFLLPGSRPAQAADAPDACAYLSRAIDAQPAGPVFLPSYPSVTAGPLQGAAFLYDNAAAAIALVACGQPARAARIGDAILLALDHDRAWHDGRLRNAYLAGAVGAGPVKLGGWWDAKQNMWVEDGYQAGSDSGNMAWAMLALLALDQATHDTRYRNGAARIGAWVARWRSRKGPGGFTGGTFGHEPAPAVESWKSTEHNTDLAAAFSALAQASADPKWRAPARAARDFVQAMWQPRCGCFAVGTGEDGVTLNRALALDAQVWPLLALPGAATRYAPAIATVRHRLARGDGLAYGEPPDEVWTEGTAQAALLMALSGRAARAAKLEQAVAAMRAPDGGYYASSAGALSTGFMLDTDPSQPRQYFHIEHLGAAAWAALMARRYNPFARRSALP